MYKIRKVKDSPDSVMREYEVYWEKDNNIYVIASVPKYYRNSKGIAEGIAAALNKRDIILDLNI